MSPAPDIAPTILDLTGLANPMTTRGEPFGDPNDQPELYDFRTDPGENNVRRGGSVRGVNVVGLGGIADTIPRTTTPEEL